MKILTINTDTRGDVKTAAIECDRKQMSLTLLMENGLRKTYTASDLFICFGLLRADFPDTKFLCKGAKLNVYPSRMSSQMSSGLVAYELQLGRPSDDTVNIFDYEDIDITHDIQLQHDFYKRWLESLAG